MRKINWKRPVETECGIRLIVTKPGFVKGIPSDIEAGRRAGPEMSWRYSEYGKAGVSFLPDIRNVEN